MKNTLILILLLFYFCCEKAAGNVEEGSIKNINISNEFNDSEQGDSIAFEIFSRKMVFSSDFENIKTLEKVIPFSIIEVFKENANENAFVNSDTRLTIKASASFMLTKKDFIITDIDLSHTNYEGPGYIIYSYKSNEKKMLK